jgi:hypothetical protein
MSWSKEERAEYMKKWRNENKEYLKKYRHKYYVQSRENEKYVSPPKEYSREKNRIWRENNRERYNDYQREYQRKLRKKIAISKWEICQKTEI